MSTTHQKLHDKNQRLLSQMSPKGRITVLLKLKEAKKELGRSLHQHEWDKIVADTPNLYDKNI